MRRALLTIGVFAIVVAVLAWWRCRDPKPERKRATARSGRIQLDWVKIRRERDLRIAKARALAARYNPTALRKNPGGVSENMFLVEPFCLLGAPETCLALIPVIEDCDAKVGEACLALAQFLSDTPPRGMLAPMYFKAACEAGLEESCDRWTQLMSNEPCGTDHYKCGWDDWRSRDPARQDRACMNGFGEVCLDLAWLATDDDRRREYYEHACQLDARGGCYLLGRLLAADCEDDPDDKSLRCLPEDEEGSIQARALACEAGAKDACW